MIYLGNSFINLHKRIFVTRRPVERIFFLHDASQIEQHHEQTMHYAFVHFRVDMIKIHVDTSQFIGCCKRNGKRSRMFLTRIPEKPVPKYCILIIDRRFINVIYQ